MFFYPDDDQNPKDDVATPADDDQIEDSDDATGLGKEDDYLDDGIEENDEVE